MFTVFIVLGGQWSVDDQLVNTVAMLQTKLAKLATRNERLEAEHAELAAELDQKDSCTLK